MLNFHDLLYGASLLKVQTARNFGIVPGSGELDRPGNEIYLRMHLPLLCDERYQLHFGFIEVHRYAQAPLQVRTLAPGLFRTSKDRYLRPCRDHQRAYFDLAAEPQRLRREPTCPYGYSQFRLHVLQGPYRRRPNGRFGRKITHVS